MAKRKSMEEIIKEDEENQKFLQEQFEEDVTKLTYNDAFREAVKRVINGEY